MKITSWTQVKPGTKFKVIKNSNGHNYPLNTILTTQFIKTPNGHFAINVAKERHPIGNSLVISDIVFMLNSLKDLKELHHNIEQEINELEKQKKGYKRKNSILH